MPWRPWNARDTVLIEGIMVLLFESLRRVRSGRDYRLGHLPVVDGATVSRKAWRRRERVAGLRQLSLKPVLCWILVFRHHLWHVHGLMRWPGHSERLLPWLLQSMRGRCWGSPPRRACWGNMDSSLH